MNAYFVHEKTDSQRSGSLWHWCVVLVNWAGSLHCIDGLQTFEPYSQNGPVELRLWIRTNGLSGIDHQMRRG